MNRKSKLLTEEIVRKIIDADKHMIFHISGEPDLKEGVFHFEMRSPDDADLKLRCLICIMQDYLNSDMKEYSACYKTSLQIRCVLSYKQQPVQQIRKQNSTKQ